jgi:hypothetical protein
MKRSVSIIVLSLSVHVCLAQVRETSTFDVVSVKRNVSGGHQCFELRAARWPLYGREHDRAHLIKTAYGVHETQIVDGPP